MLDDWLKLGTEVCCVGRGVILRGLLLVCLCNTGNGSTSVGDLGGVISDVISLRGDNETVRQTYPRSPRV